MRKLFIHIILIIALAALIVTACAGCGKTEPETAAAAPLPPSPTPAPVTAPATPPPAPAGDADPLSPGEGVYTFAWFSDTQHYSDEYGDTFKLMTRFLRDSAERLDLRYIIFTGDFVQNRNSDEEWKLASAAMESIDDIPNGVLAGNHDVGTSSTDYRYFSENFGAWRYEDKPWYGGSYEDNRCHFDLISAGSTDYIFVYVGFPVTEDTADYARRIFDEYPGRIGVLCTHDYFKTDVALSESGRTLLDRVVTPCKNVYMVLCGHRYNQALVPLPLDDNGDGRMDRAVYQIIMNYQAAGGEGGDGFIRFMQIDEEAGVLRALSYSPLTDDFNFFDTEESQLIKYPASPLFESYTRALPWLVY